MTCNIVRKSAAEKVGHVVSFADWMREGDTIISADATADITADPAISGVDVVLWLEGGEPGTAYQVKLKIITKQGRIKQVCIKVRVK